MYANGAAPANDGTMIKLMTSAIAAPRVVRCESTLSRRRERHAVCHFKHNLREPPRHQQSVR